MPGRFTCKKHHDGWWEVFDSSGLYWTTVKWEEQARKICANENQDREGYVYWMKRLHEKEQLWSAICMIEVERRGDRRQV